MRLSHFYSVNQPAFFEKFAKTGNATLENQLVKKTKLRHYSYFFLGRLKMME
jgi:hypothetical protein